MLYLFSQIAISLALAAIVGGAAGWILHRARTAKQITQLQKIVSQQRQQVNEAKTEVSIIAADFDDLKQASESEISALKEENKQIPSLNQNLEKSQLLVRQLMEKHKSEIDETNEENEKLQIKSKQIEDREKEITRLQAELDIERRKTARANVDNANGDSSHSTDTQPTSPSNDNTGSVQTNNVVSSTTTQQPESTNYSNGNRLPLSGNSIDDSDSDDIDGNDETLPNTAQTQAELAELRDQLAEESTDNLDRASSGNVTQVSAGLTRSDDLVQSDIDGRDLKQMFDTVEQHDDLKQIFGIGPVTEKTLNKLGITAYSQLAELKQHDIEKIADALQIFPGRIERDNWVGGARAQLEEVLEDL